MKAQRHLLIIFLLLLLGAGCARMGQPEGGKKDTTPPKVLAESPPNGTVHFNAKKIVIRFDELIKLDNPLQKVIFSPPLQYKPEIKPAGYPDRKIEIKFKQGETLRPNTTYTIFFGDAIRDFHEGNVLENYTYVFSTGPQLDSLKLQGRIISLPDGKLPENIIVGLYPAKDFSDSLVFRQPPYYITKADDKGYFELRNLPEGRFRLVSFSDENKNMTYQPGDERIGFVPQPVTVPSDTAYTLFLFTEPKTFALKDIQARSARHWVAGFQGDTRGIRPMVPGKTSINYIVDKEWHLWIKPVAKGEILNFYFIKNRDTLAHTRRKVMQQPVDTFVVQWDKNKLFPIDSLRLLTNMPLNKITAAGIHIHPRHSADRWRINEQGIWVFYPAPATERDTLSISIMPGTLENFAGLTNPDTLRQIIHLRPTTETGNYKIIWKDRPAGSLIAELTQGNDDKLIRRIRSHQDSVFVFRWLPPGKYHLRWIIDLNDNGRWDSGNWLQHRLPEPIVFYHKTIEIRARWDMEETFNSKTSGPAKGTNPKGLKGFR